jgi:hypothetical protein
VLPVPAAGAAVLILRGMIKTVAKAPAIATQALVMAA